MAKKQIFNYEFTPGVNQNFNAFPNAVELLERNKEYIRKNIVGFIANQVANNIAPFQNYTYNEKEFERDAGDVLDALIEDLRYNGNVNTRQISSFFWSGNIPQIDGDREPEVATYGYVIDLINNFLFTNTTVTPVYQTDIDQIKTVGFPAEAGADTRVTDLLTSLNNVIANGLGDLPAEVAPTGTKGKITLIGNYDAKKLLLINNQTFGEIIYAFADPTKIIKAIYQQQPVNETTITLYADTTRMNPTDKIQIFYEDDNQFIQPHPTYQDPVEKLRVSNPESLIDTDFEYSLQGTKWETVELVNNIPSVFSKANEPAFTADEITNVGAVSVGSATASISPLASAINGRSGLNLIRNFGPTGYSDDANYVVNLPFSIEFLGQFWNSVYVGTNGYFTFGGGASQFSGFDGNDPPFPHINMLPGDRALMKLYTGTVGGTFIIRWEGSNFGNQSSILHVWELHLSSGSNVLDLHYEQVSSSSTVGAAPVVGDGVNAAYLSESPGTPSAGDSFRLITSTGSARDLQIDVNVDPLVPFFVGQPIVIRESAGAEVDGSYLVKAVNNSRSIIVTARQLVQGSYNTQYTTIYTGGFFTGAAIPITAVNRVSGTTNARISFTSPHNFFPGQRIYVVDNNQNDQPYIGSFELVAVNSATEVEYRTDSVELFNNNNTVSTASTEVYVRSEAVGLHRYVDGGVQIKPGSPAPNTQIIRQTRKYFRYQSGKGIQFSTGVLVSPTYDILRLSVTTNVFDPVNFPFYELNIDLDSEHGFAQPDEYRAGALIEISGLTVASGPSLYNGIYRVVNVVGPKSLTIRIDPSITDFAPGGIGRVGVVEYRDAAVRDGMFDEQNGIYYEYNGKELSAVIRASTQQLTGTLNLTQDSSAITGIDTKFLTQIAVGDYIVIKGCTYKITSIADNENMVVQPDIRTQTENNVRFNKVVERQTFRSDFNLDRLDGSGPSGFVFNPLRMQMIFMDYSWYGAGKVRWGMRGLDGTIIYCHEEPNNNTRTEAYMRSGNLPGRFEISTIPEKALLTAGLTTASTTFEMSNQDAAKFPAKGRASINYEILKYTKGPQSGNVTTFNIDARNEFGLTSNATADVGDTVFSFNGNCGPALSHWGVSVIMDGRFDTDKSYLFTGLNRTAISVGTGQERPIVSIRLAPSVDNGIGRPFGVRNLINRSAVILQQVGVITTGIFEISVRINSETTLFLNDDNWQPAGNGSITQYLDHSVVGTTPLPDAGDQVFSFFSEQGDSRFSVTERNIGQIRELGNSILGGNNIYPDGPDVLTINARNITGRTEAIFARISWTESQG
jgi:hypothetical protein